MKNKIKLIPILLLSLGFVSATVVGVNNIVNNAQEQNAVKNPVLMLDANDPEAKFSTGDQKISKVVRYGTSWSTYKSNMPIPTKPGYDILGWQYSFDGANYGDVYDSLTFTQNTYLRVKGWGSVSHDTFATDSWATIVDIAQNGGLPALKDAYYADISRFGGTFVIQDYSNEEEVAAKTRTVFLKGLGEYKVHVIGEDEDVIADETNKVASLTFEFDNIVVPSMGFSMGTDDNSWENSYLRYFLKHSFIERLPEPINDPNVLQTVVKTTYDQMSSEPKFIETDDTIFIPSLSELGYSNMCEGPLITEVGSTVTGDHDIPCLDEGNPYSFYQYGSNNKMRLKTYIDGEKEIPMSYWTRSPFTKNVNNLRSGDLVEHKGVHVVDGNANVPGMLYTDPLTHEAPKIRANESINGVAPCFCIGQDTAYKLVVNVASGSNIVAKHTDYIANNLDARVQLIDERDYSAPVIHYNTGLLDTETYKEIHVAVNGQTVPTSDEQYTNYTYDRKTGLLNINIDKDYKEITGDVVVTIDKPTETKFETDSWTTFFNNAERGYDSLVNTYSSAYAANGDTFLGLKREIKLKDVNPDESFYDTTVLARVVGEKHDVTVDGATTALTFQFTQGYKVSEEESINPEDQPPVSHSYIRSDYYHDSGGYFAEFGYLGDTSEETLDIYSMHFFVDNAVIKGGDSVINPLINETDFSLKIKTVKKDVVECKDAKGRKLSVDAQLFLPSYEELTGDTSLNFEDSNHEIMHDGAQYEYYVNTDDFAHRFASGSAPFSSSMSNGVSGNCCWTRSVSKQSIKGRDYYNAIAINGQTGLAASLMFHNIVCAIIPCFAVGIA